MPKLVDKCNSRSWNGQQFFISDFAILCFCVPKLFGLHSLVLCTKDVRRHAKQGKNCAVKGTGPVVTLKPRYLGSVKACQSKVAVCQGVEVLPPDIFALHETPA